MTPNIEYCIVGASGFGREVLFGLQEYLRTVNQLESSNIFFLERPEYHGVQNIHGIPVVRESEFYHDSSIFIVAIGDPKIRNQVVSNLARNTKYLTLIHPNSILMSNTIQVGDGSIITPGCILTCDIQLGKHAHLNLNTTVGHDCIIGDFFTSSPGVNISGGCKIGNNVFIGSNASIKENVTIANNVTIGMGSVVIKDILDEGVYVGNPLRRL